MTSHYVSHPTATGEAYDFVLSRRPDWTRSLRNLIGELAARHHVDAGDLKQLLDFHFRLNVEGNFGADSYGALGLSLADTYDEIPCECCGT